MTTCSKRRKTKQPYCKDDSNCYWDKRSCKRKNSTRKVNRQHSPNNNFNLLFKKLSSVEKRLEEKISSVEKLLREMNKESSESSIANNETADASKLRKLVRNEELSTQSSNLNSSAKTADPSEFKKMLANASLNVRSSKSGETASPNARNKLRKILS